jgi:radical SAM protein with 4Fe4S-binding SPASM domain
MTIKDSLKRLLIPTAAQPSPLIEPGLYHYRREEDGQYTRFHLRVEPDGRGMLLANATLAARLSPSGVFIARGILDGRPNAAIEQDILKQFSGATSEWVQRDLRLVTGLINSLTAPGDNYPIVNLDDAAISPYQTNLIAPLEASVPLVQAERLVPLIDRLWQVAIPHVTFLVQDDLNPADLLRAIERAEDLGMIAGVRGRATDLVQESLLRDMAMAGVDHITVLYASAEPLIHNLLCGDGDHMAAEQLLIKTQQNEVCPVAEIPLVESTLPVLRQTLTTLQNLGIHNYSFFAIAAPDEMADGQREGAIRAMAMAQTAERVEELAHEMEVRFIWQPPVQRDPAVPISVQVREGPRCSGDIAVFVEPEGAVIPPRGPYRSAGNLFTDSWERIWNDDAFRRYRARVETPTRCEVCPELALCAADCPRKPAGWSQGQA